MPVENKMPKNKPTKAVAQIYCFADKSFFSVRKLKFCRNKKPAQSAKAVVVCLALGFVSWNIL